MQIVRQWRSRRAKCTDWLIGLIEIAILNGSPANAPSVEKEAIVILALLLRDSRIETLAAAKILKRFLMAKFSSE